VASSAACTGNNGYTAPGYVNVTLQ
jgi:hypothetical protein